MTKFSFSRFIYLDTCVFAELVKKQNLIRPFFDFIVQNDLCIAVSQALWIELSPKKETYQIINTILTLLPSAVIKKQDELLDKEVKSHPNMYNATLLKSPLNQLMGTQFIQKKLSSFRTTIARREMLQYSSLMNQKLDQLKPNFPPLKSGKYSLNSAELFAEQIVFRWISTEYPLFVNQFKENMSAFNSDVFKSLKIFAYYVYYKYYNQNKTVSKSDFADLFHLYCMPYCHFAIVERDMCHILNQIKSRNRILNGVIVKNMEFFNEIK